MFAGAHKFPQSVAVAFKMTINTHDTLSVFGNMNYLSGFIKHLESEIYRTGEFRNFLSEAPNYYNWLCIASEFVFYKIREVNYYKNNNLHVFDDGYKKLLDQLFEDKNIDNNLKSKIIYFAKIRHILTHKGFPNPHIAPSSSEREITKGVFLKKEETKEICEKLFEPSIFPKLEEDFKIIIKELSKPLIGLNIDFGLFSIGPR